MKEVAYIWLALHKKMNARIVFATPKGGEAPIDPMSMKEAEKDDFVRDAIRDSNLSSVFKNTQSLDSIKGQEYSAVLIPGCHGAMIDLPNSHKLAEVLCAVYEHNPHSIIATIGHGAAGLLNLRKKNSEEYYLKGKRLTGFTNEEEREKQFQDLVPYFLEDKLKERGAQFQKGRPFQSFVVEDERLITAQNSYSVKDWINKILEKAGHRERI